MKQSNRRRFLQQTTLASGAASLSLLRGTNAHAVEDENPSNPLLKTALLQMLSYGNDQEKNRNKGVHFCRKAAEMGADIALMPEIWNIGYTRFEGTSKQAIQDWQAQAIGHDSPFIRTFRDLAKTLSMAIGVTYLEKWNGAPRNSISLIDRRGNIVLTYAKVHTCDFKTMECCCTPGDDFPVAELDTAKGKVHVGSMICFDRENPESARILMLNGAELILTPNACGLDSRRLDQFKTRAFENATAAAMTNYPAPQHNGHSIAFNAEGELVVEAGEQEEIFLASFDLEQIRRHRQKTIWGNAFRRPQRYGALINAPKEAVFARNNGFEQPFVAENR
ncbi:MAG: carbon-nitrogen hydrolase family protein [Candidatus Omnitrophica bacterium]|nr:carbon-nitrogen hydrolase family protein [Candidatus Omnitrophota bacterium]